MSNVLVIDQLDGLKVRRVKRIWPTMSLRPLFAMLIAVAMLFAPLAMQSGSAMAMAPADHQGRMMEKGRCGEQPAKGKNSESGDRSCCVAMCTAVANAPVSPLEPNAFPRSVGRPSPQPFRHGYLAKLPTPPPRRA